MSLIHKNGAQLRRRLMLLCAMVACAVPVLTYAQASGGTVRVRTRCARCASTMNDSTRDRYERLVMKIDSLRWEFDHERMSPAKRKELSAEMSRTVAELQSALSGQHVAVFATEAPEQEMAREFVGTPQGFAYVAAARRSGTRGYLGVTFDGPSMEMWKGNERIIRFLDYPRISLVEPSSPADRAGVVSGDTLLAFNGDDVRDRQIALTKLLVPEKRITMRIRRGGNERDFRVKIDTSPDYIVRRVTSPVAVMAPMAPALPGEVRVDIPRGAIARTPFPPAGAMPDMQPGAWIMSDGIGGAKLQSIREGLGKALGVASGVLVLEVWPGTLAYESGLRDGDVIVRVSGTPVRNVRELRAIVEREGEDGARLTIQRERKQKEITLRW